jgi:hypothetical protein
VTYLKYTFATLGFAKNASVVRLAPKKATVAASAAERKLMAELEAMKALVASLQENANTKKGEYILRNLLTAILLFVWSMDVVVTIIIIICNALHRKRRCRPYDC